MASQPVYANGVSGLTGEYLLEPLDPAELAARAKERPANAEAAALLQHLHESREGRFFGLPFHVHAESVREAGWAIVFSSEEPDEVRAALCDLIEHRSRQLGEENVKILDYLPDETWPAWLARHRTAPGSVDPQKVPYYVLLVGPPGRIPFSFQYLLDVEYAVGRVDFDDAASYALYAQSLVEYEQEDGPLRDRSASLFGTRHPFDGATQLSADTLVYPLAASFEPGGRFTNAVPGYRIDRLLAERATKAALGEIVAGTGAGGRPSLLFSATHGLGGWPPGHADQKACHGALLCQDWPGVGRIGQEQYFAAADVQADARVHGLVAFFFACFGAGTPQFDAYAHTQGEPQTVLAPEAFVARLPQALLRHPAGGALAVIGHVDRAWGYSFVSGGEGQLLPFQNAIGRILLGEPVGHAMKDFNEKYAALSTSLTGLVESIERSGKIVPDAELARLWTERNDAQNYVVLGDPAVRVRA
jgi:Peptidase family C25